MEYLQHSELSRPCNPSPVNVSRTNELAMRTSRGEIVLRRCRCEHGIYCGVSRGGERLGFLVFYDAEQTSETYGEQVALCPRCATALDYRLLTRNSTRDQLL